MSSEFKQQEVELCLDQSVHSSRNGNSEVKQKDGTREPMHPLDGIQVAGTQVAGTQVPGGSGDN